MRHGLVGIRAPTQKGLSSSVRSGYSPDESGAGFGADDFMDRLEEWLAVDTLLSSTGTGWV